MFKWINKLHLVYLIFSIVSKVFSQRLDRVKIRFIDLFYFFLRQHQRLGNLSDVIEQHNNSIKDKVPELGSLWWLRHGFSRATASLSRRAVKSTLEHTLIHKETCEFRMKTPRLCVQTQLLPAEKPHWRLGGQMSRSKG